MPSTRTTVSIEDLVGGRSTLSPSLQRPVWLHGEARFRQRYVLCPGKDLRLANILRRATITGFRGSAMINRYPSALHGPY
jgi:hypothetical protein